MKTHIANLFALILVALFSVLATSCGTRSTASANEKISGKSRNPLAIRVSETEFDQIKIGKLSSAPVIQSMHAAGRIEADATRMVRVSAPVIGRIMKIQVLEGQHVHSGDVLATIHSTQLSDAESAFLKAHSQQQLANRAVDRAEKLLKADVIGSAELLRRQAELDQATAEVAAARSQLQIMGVSAAAIQGLAQTGKIDSATEIVANINGTVLERKVTLGQIVQPAEIVFVIGDLSRVWLVADVPEQSSGNLRVNKSAQASVSAFPGEPIHGRLSFVSSIVNPQTRTVQVRMDLPNPQHKYKPDMLATMTIENAATTMDVVPLTAIVRNGDDDDLFVRTDARTFLLTPVRLGDQVGNQRVLLGGVEPGTEIVTDGAFNLNNERLRTAQLGEE
jgi:cobalt-zinc-cadmium efflux system membrane fusion protein